MSIRPVKPEELDSVMAVYDVARGLMRAAGNNSQWVNGYPERSLLAQDIEKKTLFAVEDGGRLAGVFCMTVGEETDYAAIRGRWLDNRPYAVIHRLASAGMIHGVAKACVDWSFARFPNLRADTHRDNAVMLHLLEKNGFIRCGTVTIWDGTERIAFQKNI